MDILFEKHINNIKQNFDIFINNISKNNIKLIIKNIIEISKRGIIYVCGVGKSETIASNFSNLLKSISIRSFILNCQNSTHGDIGPINENDMIIFFSNSGNTNELLNIIDNLLERECFICSILCNKNSKISKFCNINIELCYQHEIQNKINKIPSNSLMIQNIISNIIISCLVDTLPISLDEYRLNHLNGNIGNSLRKIKNIIKFKFPKILISDKIEINKILLEMTNLSIGCCFFINQNEEYLGLLTDGDIRRLLIKCPDIKFITLKDINLNSYCENNINKYLVNIKNIKKIKFIPILDKKKIIGIVSYNDF